MFVLVLKLVLAHIIGDFLLQPGKWVLDKEKKKHKSPYLYWHILIHVFSLLVVLQFNTDYWIGIGAIAISHFTIDLIKLKLKDKINTRVLFFTDQIAHVLIIALVGYTYEPSTLHIDIIYTPKILLFITSVLAVTVVTSIFMKTIFTRWDIEGNETEDSLENAGKYIGMLERLLVFVFIITNHWAAIGFLIAAKSVFRFGDLSKTKDRKLTEYILIGTMLSFGFAIATGLCYNHFIDKV